MLMVVAPFFFACSKAVTMSAEEPEWEIASTASPGLRYEVTIICM